MKIYLAGGISGNLCPLWREAMRIYQVASGGEWCISDYIFGRGRPVAMGAAQRERVTERRDFPGHDSISGGQSLLGEREEIIPSRPADLNILESFYYVDDLITSLIPHLKHFMLDSGAFTFLVQSKEVNWESYIAKYIDYINTNKVELFFELDIDSVVGYEKVLEYRKMIEAGTGKQCIPVWHRNRGKNEFLRMCDEYPYVALGGIAIKEIKSTEYKYFPWFIREAHKRGTKIHGLGFTSLSGLKKYHFDSVDSSAWTSGNRFGHVYKFENNTLKKYDKPEGTRMKPRETAINNFTEWVKFAKYAEKHL